jgi:hypothetical protein
VNKASFKRRLIENRKRSYIGIQVNKYGMFTLNDLDSTWIWTKEGILQKGGYNIFFSDEWTEPIHKIANCESWNHLFRNGSPPSVPSGGRKSCLHAFWLITWDKHKQASFHTMWCSSLPLIVFRTYLWNVHAITKNFSEFISVARCATSLATIASSCLIL